MATATDPKLARRPSSPRDASRPGGDPETALRALPRRGAALLGDDVLASLLIRHQVASERDVERCFEESVARGTFLEERAIAAGIADAPRLLELLEGHFFCPAVDLRDAPADPAVLGLVPAAIAVRHLVLPWRLEGDTLRVIMAQPDRPRLREVVARACGRRILPAVALRHELWRAVEAAYGGVGHDAADPALHPPAAAIQSLVTDTPRRTEASQAAEPASASPPAQDASSVVESVMRLAVERGATDVHVEPGETELCVRLRVDGILAQVLRLPPALTSSMASRLKVLSGMDISERRAPQDGRATFRIGDEVVDVRASCLPSRHGEKIVLRLLRRDAALLRAENLRMPAEMKPRHREMIEAPMGLFLVTGPTGSGKTTTLYATLNAIDRDELAVVTLEDPIEYLLPGVTQVQIHDVAGLSFASGLKSILRQDPDVILVGEIREAETAEIACKAALTGHKVLSSLHANDACQAVTRLTDMGVARDLIAATLKGVIAQRLLRRICEKCKAPHDPTELELRLLGGGLGTGERAWSGSGCAACGRSGYKGRFAVFEYAKLDEDLARMVLERASAGAIKQAARRAGMRTMLDAGRDAVASGDTTIAEVQRVLLSADGSEDCCPRCGRGVSPDFTSCPYCLHALRETCRSCSRPVHEGWRACPSCGTPRGDRREAPQCGRCAAPLEPGWVSCPYCLVAVP